MNNRSHPVRQLLDHLAIGGTLTSDDLRVIQFPEGVDRAPIELGIREAARKIADYRATGHRGRARQVAIEAAGEIIARAGTALPEHVDYPTDPRALAALVRRDAADDLPALPTTGSALDEITDPRALAAMVFRN